MTTVALAETAVALAQACCENILQHHEWLVVFSALRLLQLRMRRAMFREHFLPDTTPVPHPRYHPLAGCEGRDTIQ